MSKLRSLNTGIWNDTWFEELSVDRKLLFIYLITNEKTNMLGIYEISIRKISFETGIPADKITESFDYFEKSEKIKYQNNRVILLNFLKHQNYNLNMKKSAIDCYNSLPNSLKIDGKPLLERNDKGFETLCKGFGMVRKIEEEIEEEIEGEEINNYTLINQIEPKGFDSLHFTIAKMFHSLFVKLRGETETLKKVKTEKYVNTIRLLLEKDKISVTQLAALKLYLEDSKKEGSKLNSFWADTIFSVDSFRGKAKNGTYKWDLICLELKKWQTIEGNVQRAQKLTETINTKAKDYDRIQEGV